MKHGLARNQGTRQAYHTGNLSQSEVRNASANNNFYANIGVNAGYSTSKNSNNSHNESAVVTTMKLMNENSSITYNNVNNITYQGTQAQGGTFIYNRAIGEIAGGFLGGAVEKDISKTIVKNGSNSIYQNYAEKATKNANSTSVMLGKYNQDGISYIKAAGNKHTY